MPKLPEVFDGGQLTKREIAAAIAGNGKAIAKVAKVAAEVFDDAPSAKILRKQLDDMLDDDRADAIKALIERMLDSPEGKKRLPSEELDMSRQTMYEQLRDKLAEDFGIEPKPEAGSVELDARTTRLIDEWVDGGRELSEFFEAAGDSLGDMAQYDLSRWQGDGDKYALPGEIRDALDEGRIQPGDVAHLGDMLEHDPDTYDLSQWQ